MWVRSSDGILGFSAYTLAYTLPRIRDPVKQRLGVYVWTGISVVMFGVLMNLFKIKQGACELRTDDRSGNAIDN